jgi:hypothetical protein
VLRATFPAGTVSGAPKVRAMEIIDELEPTKRGIYAGSVGYLSFNGDMDLAIAIRTGVVKDKKLTSRPAPASSPIRSRIGMAGNPEQGPGRAARRRAGRTRSRHPLQLSGAGMFAQKAAHSERLLGLR